MYDSEFGVIKEIYFVKKKYYDSLSLVVEEELKQKIEELVTRGFAVKPPHPDYGGNGKSLVHMHNLIRFMQKYVNDPNYIVFEIKSFVISG